MLSQTKVGASNAPKELEEEEDQEERIRWATATLFAGRPILLINGYLRHRADS